MTNNLVVRRNTLSQTLETRHIHPTPINQAEPVSTVPEQSNNIQAKASRPFRRPLGEIIADINMPIPARFIKTKPQHDKQSGRTINLKFVSWYDVIRILEARAPGFEYDCEPHFADGKTVVKATITIHGSDGSLSRSALGIEDSQTGSWGDPTSNASSMALRRAAASFGLGLHLYFDK